jgi:hypothetical protein
MKYFLSSKTKDFCNSYTEKERFSEVKLVIVDEVGHLKYTSLVQLLIPSYEIN